MIFSIFSRRDFLRHDIFEKRQIARSILALLVTVLKKDGQEFISFASAERACSRVHAKWQLDNDGNRLEHKFVATLSQSQQLTSCPCVIL